MQNIPEKYRFRKVLLKIPILFLILLFVGCAIRLLKSAHIARKLPSLRILTYNIRTGLGMDGQRDLNHIAKIIRDVRPDVVVLQEVDNGTRRANGLNQARYLAQHTGLDAYYFPAMPFDGGQYGIALLTRLPVTQRDTLPLPGEPRVAGAIRVVWRCSSAAETLWVIGTHLDTEPRPRRQSVALLHQWVQQFGSAPAILAGDLNAPPDSPTLRGLTTVWTLPEWASPLYTFPADTPRVQIDYVLYRPADAWKVVRAEVLHEPVASDHRPLLVVLQYQGECSR